MNAIATYTFDEMVVGMEVSREKLVTKETIKQFAEIVDDYHPLHTSESFAISQGHRDVIAHGLLIASYSSALIGMQLPGENSVIVSQSFKYRHPAYPGDLLLIKGTVAEIDQRFSRVLIKIMITPKEDEERVTASGQYLIKFVK